MDWEYSKLLNKAKLYVARAFPDGIRDPALTVFWATIALEFLGRATLAKIHPSLVADPQNGDNLLYACGVSDMKSPKSVVAKTVFLRCQQIVSEFTTAELNFVMSLMERRNEEVHSGALPFEDFPDHEWQAAYFRVCKILLTYQKLTLVDLFGNAQAAVAEKLVRALETEVTASVKKLVGQRTAIAQNWTPSERTSHSKDAESAALTQPHRHYKKGICPACGLTCVITGEPIHESEPVLDADEIVTETTYLPSRLFCGGCALELKGLSALRAAGLDNSFKILTSVDAREYYLEDFDPHEYYRGGEYQNS